MYATSQEQVNEYTQKDASESGTSSLGPDYTSDFYVNGICSSEQSVIDDVRWVSHGSLTEAFTMAFLPDHIL